MKLTRRSFVKLGSIVAFASLGMPKGVFGSESKVDALAGISAGQFQSFIGTQFEIVCHGMAFTAILSEVSEFVSSAKQGECFSLTFECDASDIGQEVFSLTHFALGSFELLMVGNKEGGKNRLVATINRI